MENGTETAKRFRFRVQGLGFSKQRSLHTRGRSQTLLPGDLGTYPEACWLGFSLIPIVGT